MNKIRVVLIGFLLVQLLSGCSFSQTQAQGIPLSKMTPDEHTAFIFTRDLYSDNQSKQINAINSDYASKESSTLIRKIQTGKLRNKMHEVKVTVSIEKQDNKGAYTLVLLKMKDPKNQVKERILLMRHGRIEKIHSPGNSHFKKEYNAIMKEMKQANS
ncbi:hypothetical protein [Sporolactobacillus spathodeae]|uniref:ABC-type sulfate/molybdate transport systems ATPase subunit n=1 Tax=Sporolactobacillus spathodeae TaxID=1465502 RepID=A0ABS2Q7E5_9BACL|nr:hypothetical protein [Sporolactobacillus spathodeae]MBM7657099.1 ABC-type sulfate/molybdate transport systems ATPase subunit [Sporolactobacillus spathodeae]